jgi:nucleoside-diphosphate-sugar epimerase
VIGIDSVTTYYDRAEASSSSVYVDAERFPTPSASPRAVSPHGATKLAVEHFCNLYFSRFGCPPC